MRSFNGTIPSCVDGSNWGHFFKCSSDRKKCMVLQAWAICAIHSGKGTDTCPTIPAGSAPINFPSFISI